MEFDAKMLKVDGSSVIVCKQMCVRKGLRASSAEAERESDMIEIRILFGDFKLMCVNKSLTAAKL